VCDNYAEMSLAAQTGELTDRLVKLLHALESVQASSVESERAFSCAGSFVTKVRNRMGDETLDNYCFARHKLQMAKKLVLVAVIKYSFAFLFKKKNDPDSGSVKIITDPSGRLKKLKDPDSGFLLFCLPLGSLIVFTDPDSGSLNFLSLPLGSLFAFTVPDSGSLNFLSLPLGSVINFTDLNGSVKIITDPSVRLKKIKDPESGSVN
jgi:hypothetical protein